MSIELTDETLVGAGARAPIRAIDIYNYIKAKEAEDAAKPETVVQHGRKPDPNP